MPTRDEYVEVIKSAALTAGKKTVLALLTARLPVALTTGFVGSLVNPLLGYLVGMILEIAIRETEIGLFFLYIDLRTSAQGRAFEKSARENFEAVKRGNLEEMARAEKKLIDDFRAFAKFTN